MQTTASASELVRRWRARRQDLLRRMRARRADGGRPMHPNHLYYLRREARAWETAANELEALYRDRDE